MVDNTILSDNSAFLGKNELLNKLYLGDNLEILKTIPDEYIDLIYLDPPFNTGRDFKDFKDKFKSLEAFIDFLNLRIIECHRALKKTGVFCLHLDYRSVHYLKIELDKIFGEKNFINEIIWCYQNGGKSKDRFAKKHDTILIYSKTKDFKFNSKDIKIPYELISKNSVSPFNLKDKDGRKYQRKVVSNGKVYTYYKDEGKIPNDWWIDIQPLTGRHGRDERLGYPTQKPLSLLDRLIKAFSNNGDLILDPFCGSGTTIVSAKNLKRNYIGIDQNLKAIEITKKRLSEIKEENLLTSNELKEMIK